MRISLRSCGLSETFVLHFVRLGKLTLEISALFTSDILTSVDSQLP